MAQNHFLLQSWKNLSVSWKMKRLIAEIGLRAPSKADFSAQKPPKMPQIGPISTKNRPYR